MGVGNLTELTDVDSAGVNTLLVGFCQELAIRSVLTTAVINWARSSVREIDLARRLTYHAVTRKTLPKHLEPGWSCSATPGPPRFGRDASPSSQRRIKDPNWRIFAEDGRSMRITMPLSSSIPTRSSSSIRWVSPTRRMRSTWATS